MIERTESVNIRALCDFCGLLLEFADDESADRGLRRWAQVTIGDLDENCASVFYACPTCRERRFNAKDLRGTGEVNAELEAKRLRGLLNETAPFLAERAGHCVIGDTSRDKARELHDQICRIDGLPK